MLQHFEQLSSVFAQAVSVWSMEYGVRAIIGEVIRLVYITRVILIFKQELLIVILIMEI